MLLCIAVHTCSHGGFASLVYGALQAVMLDEVMESGTKPQADHLLQFETRSLRDTRQLLSTVSLADTLQFVEQNPHPRYMSSSLLLHNYASCSLHDYFAHAAYIVSYMAFRAFGHLGY